MDTPGCPSRERLLLLLEERLPPDEAQTLTAHAEACPTCQQALEELTAGAASLRARLRPTPAEQAPPVPAFWSGPAAWPEVPGYELLGVLGRGGEGVVYKARHLALGRLVALKMVRHAGAGGPAQLQRFRREAELLARLRHPHIVQVYEVGEHDGLPFFALEHAEGGSLADRLTGQPLPAAAAAGLVEAVARAVHAAHQAGVVHRDLKPANILLQSAGGPGADGQPEGEGPGQAGGLRGCVAKVSDFGLAKAAQAGGGVTASGAVLGTPEYMAPEQAQGRGRQAGPLCDIYALGAVLYQLLTGRTPFVGEQPLDVLLQVVHQEPLPPRRLWPHVPRDLETVCLKCLRKEPHKRYASALLLAEDLQRFLNGEPVVARRVGAAERLVKWVRRRPTAAGLLAAVLLLVLAGVAGAWQLHRQRADAQARQQQTDREARGVLGWARGLLEEGWKTHDRAKLTEAKAEADRAVDIARSGAASDAVRQQAAAFQAEAEERRRRWQKNEALRGALLDVSAPPETRAYRADVSGQMVALAQPSVDEQYAAAFQRWGLDVAATGEAAVVARLRQEPEVVVQEVVAGLDGWALERRRQKGPEGQWRRLTRITEQLDRNDTRRQLRALLLEGPLPRAEVVAGPLGAAGRDLARGKNWQRLQGLRGQMNLGGEPVLTVMLLAQAYGATGDGAGAEQVLRQALARRPRQVVLLQSLAQVLEQRGPSRLGEAIGCYRAVRALQPSVGVALAQALVKARQEAEGEAVLRDLVRQQPDNPEMHVNLGTALRAQKKLGEAEAAYRKAIALQPDYPRAYNDLGAALYMKRPVDAEGAFRKAIALKPDYAKAHSNLGAVLLEQRKSAEAEANLRKAIALNPNFAEAYSNLGVALLKQKRPAEAEAACRQAIALQPDYADAHSNLGNVLREQKKLAEAEAACRKAIALDPDKAGAYNSLGATLLAQKKLAEAEAACRQAIALQPNFAGAYTNLGIVLHDQKRPSEAEAALRKAIALQPDDATAYYNLGVALGPQRKQAEAEAAYRKAIALKPDFASAYHNLGNALLDQQKPAEAEAAFRKATALRPGNAEAYTSLGVALGQQRKQAEAEAAYRKAIALQPDYAEAHYNLGNALLDQQKPAEAVAAFRKAIALQPDFAKAHNNLGNALAEQRKPAEAEAAYRKAIALQPDYAEAYTNLSIALLDQKKPVEAEAACHKAIALQPGLAAAHNALGNALADQKKLGEAEAAYRKAIALQPDYAKAHNNLGLALAAQKKLGEAVAAFRKATALQSDYAQAHYNLGLALLNQKKLREAEAALRKAVALRPDDAKAHNNLGTALREQKKLAEAEAACRKAVTLDPDNAGAYHNLGNALLDQKKLAEAEVAFRKAVTLEPGLAEAHNGLGNALANQGKTAEAEAAVRKAIAVKPDYAEAHYHLGLTLHDQKKPGEAAAAFRKAVELKPDFAKAHHNLGLALLNQKKPVEAEASFHKAVALRPNYAEAHNGLGNALVDRSKPAEAEAAYRKATALQPNYAEAHNNLGLVLAEQKKFAGAEAAFRKVVALRPDEGGAHTNLGLTLLDQGKFAGAEAAFRKVVALDPDDGLAHYNLGNALQDQRKPVEAEAAFRKAIALQPDYALAHFNLGGALTTQGRLAEALTSIRRGHELGVKQPGWPYPSKRWVRQAEQLVEAGKKLPAYLKGEYRPRPEQGALLGRVCLLTKRYRAAARLYADAFAEAPKLATGPQATHRYDAACAAALAGCGQGKDAAKLDDKERARLRAQALTWLQADLAALGKHLRSGPPGAAGQVRQRLRNWQVDPDLGRVRGKEALARLPGAEREGWNKLWEEVATLVTKAPERPPKK